MLTFTLDTNCIIAVDEGRPETAAVRQLALLHEKRQASVAIVAISASERQKTGGHLENFAEFQDRIKRLGLSHLVILEAMAYADIAFWDHCLATDEAMESLEKEIHQILFPNIPFLWTDFAQQNGIAVEAFDEGKKWRNAKCDVQAFWAHIFHKREVFVTSDKNFHSEAKKQALLVLSGGRIETPAAAAELAEL